MREFQAGSKKEGGDIASFHPFNMFPSYRFYKERNFSAKWMIFNGLKHVIMFYYRKIPH
jgi:hypothetical protein